VVIEKTQSKLTMKSEKRDDFKNRIVRDP
jgi:hypothetical protein